MEMLQQGASRGILDDADCVLEISGGKLRMLRGTVISSRKRKKMTEIDTMKRKAA